MVKNLFHERLRQLRIEKGITQADLAAIADLSLRGYRKFELGENSPNLVVLIALADYFNVSLDYLVGRSDDPKVS